MKWNVGWGVTSLCNMNCGFCYSKTARSCLTDLPISSCYKFIDKNYNYISSINYGTGENTMLEDWYDFAYYVKQKYSIEQALTTNGFISNQVTSSVERLNKFRNSIDEVDVSIDYIDEEKHCKLRGNKEVYKWAINTLNICRELGKTATIVFVGMKDNLTIENIDGLFELAKKYEVKLRMNLYRPTGGINAHSQKYIPSYEQILYVLKYIDTKYKVLAIDDVLFGSLLVKGFRSKDPSGIESLRILPDGNITPSTYLITNEYVLGNILTHSLSDLNSHIQIDTCDKCQSCNLFDVCRSGVIDRRYLWYGTGNMYDPYCPIHNGFKMPDFKITSIPDNDNNLKSIHHGYLPTMFFSP